MPHPAQSWAALRARTVTRYTAAPDRGSRRSDRLNRSTVYAPQRRRLAGGAVKWRREAALLPCCRTVRSGHGHTARAAAHDAPARGSTVTRSDAFTGGPRMRLPAAALAAFAAPDRSSVRRLGQTRRTDGGVGVCCRPGECGFDRSRSIPRAARHLTKRYGPSGAVCRRGAACPRFLLPKAYA